MTAPTVVDDYIRHVIEHHLVVRPLGSQGTVWAGIDFTRAVSVIAPDREEAIRDLRTAIEDWLALSLRSGDRVPVLDDIDLNGDAGQRFLAWHDAHACHRGPDQEWFWTPEWQAGERAADADFDAGRSSVSLDGEEFLRSLDEGDSA